MDYDNCRSLPAMFLEQAERLGDKPFLWAKRGGRYQLTSWAAAARDVRRLARGLTTLGIGRGDGAKVSFNMFGLDWAQIYLHDFAVRIDQKGSGKAEVAMAIKELAVKNVVDREHILGAAQDRERKILTVCGSM